MKLLLKYQASFFFCSFFLSPWQCLEATGFLHTQGQDIVDESGSKIMLRGVGLGNWMLPEGYMWRFGAEGDRPRKIEKLISDLIGPKSAARFWSEFRRQYISEKDIQRISELGFNSVRPALNSRLFLTEGDPSEFRREGFELLENLVNWCKKYGLYVIIDMHAAPGGQTGQNIDDSAKDEPELFIDKKNQDRLVDLWVRLCSRYKDEPTVAAYDLLNEPLPKRTGAEAKFKDQLEPLYRRIARAIRAVDKRHMLTVEGADWANDWSVFSAPFDDNIVYQFHYYCWDRPTKLNSINKYLDERKRLGAPVWVGETGEKDNAIYWATTDYFEANNVGWSFWPWKKMDTQNTPYSINRPTDWQQISAYSRGGGAMKPSRDTAQKVFDELLQNIRLENCVFFPDVVSAILRRVPGRVEAENYGHEGADKSYFVNNNKQNSKFYRTSEPVPVEVIESTGEWRSQQSIRLAAGEWTAYAVDSQQPQSLTPVVRAKPAVFPAVFELSLDTCNESASLTTNGWQEVRFKPVRFAKGSNHLQLAVKSGTVFFDWADFR